MAASPPPRRLASKKKNQFRVAPSEPADSPARTEWELQGQQKNGAYQNNIAKAWKTELSLDLKPTEVDLNVHAKPKNGDCLIK